MRQTIQSQRSTIPQTLRIPATATRPFTTTLPRPHNPSTVDPTEVSHFDALASSWWDPHGSSRLLHLMNPLRHDFIASCRFNDTLVPSHKLRYLDIGCGGGIFAESAARLPDTDSVTAIDPTPGVLKIAEVHKRRDPLLMEPGRLTYLNTSIEDLPVPKTPEEGYDMVTLFEVLEHVNAPGPFIEKLLSHVKPGGWLVMSTIARTWTSWLVTNVMAEDVLGIVPKGTHEWSKYVNEDELRGYFAKEPGWDSASVRSLGVMYVPGLGWKEVRGGEDWGNYFFAVKRLK
ncbi:hexaprenyldihydroxybenzoate methyltransferase mitochondrial precursor [Didymella exigua CBS 183.55]|uniref:Ubiquinone biosynthesis O-methyltransferase, mitochondrial n=1 Tax=Didymella exigua CBS 183.55 TaxID=1150837 RepID=A0A6A5R4E1_9PLEO|nr:hexaprenyldihydroxybenzoate methyltransferase mitochondrial precursor [Didymella exigua CBS 183.55]KAF1922961.1 hexaprenyldihydroxybenzoate methyltransferase mitochondrial precursor [Didymella exigua CBS 183.55]